MSVLTSVRVRITSLHSLKSLEFGEHFNAYTTSKKLSLARKPKKLYFHAPRLNQIQRRLQSLFLRLARPWKIQHREDIDYFSSAHLKVLVNESGCRQENLTATMSPKSSDPTSSSYWDWSEKNQSLRMPWLKWFWRVRLSVKCWLAIS